MNLQDSNVYHQNTVENLNVVHDFKKTPDYKKNPKTLDAEAQAIANARTQSLERTVYGVGKDLKQKSFVNLMNESNQNSN